YEHVPRVSPQRWSQLRNNDSRSDWFDPRALSRSGDALQPAVRLQLVRFLHRRLPSEDRFAHSAFDLASRDCGAWLLTVDQAFVDEIRASAAREHLAVHDLGQDRPLAIAEVASVYGL